MKQIKPEFSYPVEVSRIPSTSMTVDLTANEQECKALAERFKVISIDSLTARVVLKSVNRSQVRVKGAFKTEVTQACVVSLEPFSETIEDEFCVLFGENENLNLNKNEIDLDMSAQEETDAIENGKIDIGELVAEYVALDLNPFPRSSDAEFCYETTEETSKKPFSALEKLKLK